MHSFLWHDTCTNTHHRCTVDTNISMRMGVFCLLCDIEGDLGTGPIRASSFFFGYHCLRPPEFSPINCSLRI